MRSLSLLVALAFVVLTAADALAQTKYWDVDVVSRAGAGGATPSGIWNTASNVWNTDSTGLGLPGTWTPGGTAVFSAGSTATGAYTVAIIGTQSLNELIVEEGVITHNGGTLEFGAAAATIDVFSGAGWGQSTSAVITGTGGIVKTGGGVLVLRGNNTFRQTGSGDQPFLSIMGGTVDFAADANLGAVPSASDNGAALTIDGGTLRYSGTSAFALAANRGVFIGSNGATFNIMEQDATIALAAGAPAENALTGSGTITKTGAGRLRLQTAQTTFTGKYVVKGGSLTFGSQDRLGAIPTTTQADYFTLDGGGLYGDVSTGTALNAKRGITLGANGGYLAFVGNGLTSYDGIIAGTQGGGLSLTPSDTTGSSATGFIALNSANTYNGPTLVATGMTLAVGVLANGGANSGIGSSSSAATNLVLDGGTLRYFGDTVSTDRNFTITSAGGSIDASGRTNSTLSLTNTASIGLSGTGARVLVLRGTSTGDNTFSQAIVDASAVGATTLSKTDAGTWVLKNTANSYTGNTAISLGGRLKLGASGVIPDASLVQLFTSATLDLNGFDETVKSISGASGTIDLGSKTLSLKTAQGETFSGSITGTGGRLMVTNGSLKLSPTAATYTGGVVLNASKLPIGNNTALGTGPLAANGCTLLPNGTTPIALTNSVWLNGTISFGDYTTQNPGSFTWNTNGNNKWTIIGADRTVMISTLTPGYEVTINQAVAEEAPLRGLTKAGNGKLTLNGANTYTGNTVVQDGVLSLGRASLADLSAVILSSLATLNLSFSANTPDVIEAFYINGVKQTNGVWGAIGSGAMFESSQITGTGLLRVGDFEPPPSTLPLPGDFNNDGKVDTSDYITWQKNRGTNTALLNDNGLGTPVRQAHYDLWRQNYGNVRPAGSAALTDGTIPEPGSLLLAAIALAAWHSVSRQRR